MLAASQPRQIEQSMLRSTLRATLPVGLSTPSPASPASRRTRFA
jgi:hypothetical protein